MTARYGDFVLYRPPLRATTALLWFGPALLLMIGAFIAARVVRARRRPMAAPLSAQDHLRAERLLAGADSTERS